MTLNGIVLAGFVTVAWVIGAGSLYEVIVNFSTQWYWLIAAAFYSVLLNDIFAHIICSHRAIVIDPSRIAYKILLLLTSVDHAWAPVTGLCKLHQNHHQYADQGNRDNLNWRLHWFNLCSLSPLTFLYVRPTVYPNLETLLHQQTTLHSALINDSYTQFVERNRILLTLIYWLLLYLIMPVLLFKVVLMGRFLFSIFMIMAAIAGHVKIPFGYRNFDTPDTSHNNLLFHYLALGLMPSMLQNNHHGSDKNSHKWFEFDTAGVVIKILKPLLESRQ